MAGGHNSFQRKDLVYARSALLRASPAGGKEGSLFAAWRHGSSRALTLVWSMDTVLAVEAEVGIVLMCGSELTILLRWEWAGAAIKVFHAKAR